MVYPRVGGATHNHGGIGHAVSGLPPRGRGNPAGRPNGHGSQGSTPAWAGQPTSTFPLMSFIKVYPRVGGATSIMMPH